MLVVIRLVMRRSEEHTSELQSLTNLVCRLLLEKKKSARSEEHTSELQSLTNLLCRLLLEKKISCPSWTNYNIDKRRFEIQVNAIPINVNLILIGFKLTLLVLDNIFYRISHNTPILAICNSHIKDYNLSLSSCQYAIFRIISFIATFLLDKTRQDFSDFGY